MRVLPFLAFAAAIGGASCTPGAIDPSGRSCPCAPGYTCGTDGLCHAGTVGNDGGEADAPEVPVPDVPTDGGTFVLTVDRQGCKSGTVTSGPPGIDCGLSCAARFAAGTPVTLTEMPDPGATFDGWAGACMGTASCVVVMDADQAVTANFSLPTIWVFGEIPTADVFGVTTDTMIESDAPANNFGSSDNLFIDASPPRTGLLRFELGAIGATARVNSAEFHLWTHWNPLLDGTVQVFQMLEAWDEGTVNGLPGVANWTDRLSGSPSNAPWTTAGAGPGSHGSIVIAEFPSDPTFPREYVGDLTPVVQGWVSNPATNFGMALLSTSPSGDGVEFVPSQGSPANDRPHLIVSFCP